MATTAGVLGLILGAGNLIGAGVLLNAFRQDSSRYDKSLTIFATLGALLLAFALSYGAILLLRRDETGRYLVIVASGSMLVIGVLGLIGSLTGYDSGYGIHWFTEATTKTDAGKSPLGLVGILTALIHHSWIAGLIALVAPLLTFITTASRPTRIWTTTQPRSRLTY